MCCLCVKLGATFSPHPSCEFGLYKSFSGLLSVQLVLELVSFSVCEAPLPLLVRCFLSPVAPPPSPCVLLCDRLNVFPVGSQLVVAAASCADVHAAVPSPVLSRPEYDTVHSSTVVEYCIVLTARLYPRLYPAEGSVSESPSEVPCGSLLPLPKRIKITLIGRATKPLWGC